MRYAEGGGLTDERRTFHESLRLEAAEQFRSGEDNPVIARDLRISERSVQRWRLRKKRRAPAASSPARPDQRTPALTVTRQPLGLTSRGNTPPPHSSRTGDDGL
ncbi:helix-turn-helix domain-containing protein [Streptomyces sp. B5E4]|uniref:helix-turn-helix domain-containing protein n=1 Tax=Streptomyces sp. B5E4 TaxID=3153568 RepID=UPI00325DB738